MPIKWPDDSPDEAPRPKRIYCYDGMCGAPDCEVCTPNGEDEEEDNE